MDKLADFDTFDQEIGRHLSALLDLRRRRNLFTLISRLPQELLGDIFLLVLPETFKERFNAIQRLLSVCKHWQETILCHPQLWSRWSLMNPKLLPVFASRSGTAPLTIQMNEVDPAFLEAWADLLNDRQIRDRVHEIDIIARESSIVGLLAPFSDVKPGDGPHPLRSLRIDNFSPNDSLVALPPSFSSTPLPELRVLHLIQCSVNWMSEILQSPKITHLTLDGVTSSDDAGVALLAFLRSHPLLQELVVNQIPAIDQEDSVPVELQHLKLIKLEGSFDTCMDLMAQVSYPPRTTIQLKVEAADLEQLKSRVLPLLLNRCGTPSHPLISNMTLRSAGNGGSSITLSRGNPSSSQGDITVTVLGNMPPMSILGLLTASLPLGSLVRVLLRNVIGTQQQWRAVLGAMASVETLHLELGSFPELFAVLGPYAQPEAEETPAPLSSPTGQLLLPHLKRISMEYIKPGLEQDTLVALKSFLQLRKSVGQPVDTLCVRNSFRNAQADMEECALWAELDWQIKT